MTIDKKEVISIPKWLILVIIPILVGGMGGYASSRASSARTEKQVEVNTRLLDSKVSRDEFALVIKQLDRIELSVEKVDNKLDDHSIITK